MKGPLSGVRVLDVSRAIAGPYGAMVLADLGAEVIHIEPPGGDMNRFMTSSEQSGRASFYRLRSPIEFKTLLTLRCIY